MRIISKMLKKRAVYWAPTGRDNDGNPIYEEMPIELKVRWEEKHQQFTNAAGESFVCSIHVFVDQDVELGGLIKYGPLDSLTSTRHEDNTEIYEIQIFDKTPTLKHSKYVREVWA